MADRYQAPGGWTVEVVVLSGTPDHHDGTLAIRPSTAASVAAQQSSPAETKVSVPSGFW